MHTNKIISIKAVGNQVLLKSADADLHSIYFHDESKITAKSLKSISFPTSIEQISSEMSYCYNKDIPIRISGARTGLAAGAVPLEDEHLISLTKLNKIIELTLDNNIIVQAGVSLKEVNSYLDENNPELLFPVDPTETSASIAGAVATNAGGARSFKYGSMRSWVEGLTVILPCGDILKLKRGQYKAKDFKFEIEDSYSKRSLEAKKITKPKTKNTLSYSFEEDVDLIDLFIGSEGTLGVIVEVELGLISRPKERLFLLQLFEDEQVALSFVKNCRDQKSLDCLYIECCDKRSLDLAKQSSIAKTNRAVKIIKDSHVAAVMLEIDISKSNFETAYEMLSDLLTEVSMEDSIAGMEEKDLREIKAFRHAIPETINQIIAKRKQEFPNIHKLGTDMAVPDQHLFDVYKLYKETLSKAKLDFTIFGHAGNNHFHVNILPKDEKELELAKEKYYDIAKAIVELDGAVSAEHGIGKLKKEFLNLQYDSSVFEQFKKIKDFFDPKNLINREVFF